MRVFNDIEGLVYYATAHLMLDELDIAVVRNQILDELHITDYIISEVDYEAIEELGDPNSLLAPILDYAVGTELVQADDRDVLASKLMGMLTKRPSELADMFASAIKNPQKATEWFYDYNIKSNYLNLSKLAKNKHWEAKGTVGKIEVVIDKNTMPAQPSTKYPQCGICIENEGYAPRLRHAMRVLPVELQEENWCWYFVQNSIIPQHLVVANTEHVVHPIDSAVLNKLFDFNQTLPHYFVGCLDGQLGNTHQHFVGGHKNMPLFKAKSLRQFKSAEHPLVEIAEVDWYNNLLRIVGADRERIIECASSMIQSWQNTDSRNGVAATLRKDRDGRFVLELNLLKASLDENKSPIKSGTVGLLDSLGVFSLDGDLDLSMELVEKYLTKEIKFVAEKLPDNLKKHSQMIAKLIKEVGSSKVTQLESQLNIRDELNSMCETILSQLSVFKTPKEKDSFYTKLGLSEKKGKE